MSIKDSFTEDEWFLLSSTPALIGASMSAADSSGVIGTVKEMTASMRATVDAQQGYSDSELIQALLKKSENWDEAKEKISDYREKTKDKLEQSNIKSADQLQAQMLDDVKKCVALVDDKCTADDARTYEEWSLKVADAVAAAAKEGGFLGIGGTRISDNEKALLAKIQTALGIDANILIA
jgi:phosphohistidine swiveling domain-containing protein